MSLTPNTEIEEEDEVFEETKNYLFTVSYTSEGIRLEDFLDVSSVTGSVAKGILAAEKLTGKKLNYNSKFNADQRAVMKQAWFVMGMRKRYNPRIEGPYRVDCESELTHEHFEQYLQTLEPEARKKFLKGAAI